MHKSWMILGLGALLLILSSHTVSLHGQSYFSNSVQTAMLQEESDDEDWKGFSFGLNLGSYFGRFKSAQFYNGTCNEALDEQGNQCFTIEERLSEQFFLNTYNEILNKLNIGSFTIPNGAYPGNVRYKPSILIGGHMRYTFNRTNAVFGDFNVMRLRTVDVFTLQTDQIPDGGQGNLDIRTYSIEGQESRFQLLLGYHTANPMEGNMNWYFDAAVSVLGVKPVSNDLVVEGSRYSLFINRVDVNNFTNARVPRSTVGVGFMFGTGLEVFFKDNYFINLGFNVSHDKVELGNYNERLLNKSIVARFAI